MPETWEGAEEEMVDRRSSDASLRRMSACSQLLGEGRGLPDLALFLIFLQELVYIMHHEA